MTSIFTKMHEQYKPTFLRYEQVQNCCGAGWIGYFPQGNDRDYESLVPTIKKEVLWHKKNTANSLTLIVLNHHQAKFFDETIKEAGFRCLVRDAFHPNHGNNLTLYGWEKHEKQAGTKYDD